MAIERDMGAGGINMLPDMMPEGEVMVEGLPQTPVFLNLTMALQL